MYLEPFSKHVEHYDGLYIQLNIFVSIQDEHRIRQ